MYGNKNGFTLIEILIVIAIIGLLLAITIPNLMRLSPERRRIDFITELNSLTQFAWQNALSTGVTHRLLFAFDDNVIRVEQEDSTHTTKEGAFKPVTQAYLNTTMTIPEQFEIRNFIVEGIDEMAVLSGRSDRRAWIFIIPDGGTQMLTVNMLDYDDELPDGSPRPVGLVLNPFNAQFVPYDSFKR